MPHQKLSCMRILLHNPHKVNLFGKTVRDWCTGGKIPAKYGFLRKHIRTGEIAIYCDPSGSSFQFVRRFGSLARAVNLVEVLTWLIINRVSPFRVKILWNPRSLQRSDIAISLSYSYMDNNENRSKELFRSECIKFILLSHYMIHTSTIAQVLRQTKRYVLAGESNFAKHSPYFQNAFPFYKRTVYVLPFHFAERFRNIKRFSERRNRCVALGTVGEVDVEEPSVRDFVEWFRVNTFHPMRKMLYEKRHGLEEVIDCKISHADNELKSARERLRKPTGKFLTRSVIQIRNYWIYQTSGNYARRTYYDADIVEILNNYKMVVVPEEASGAPGIGFVEAMACGCAYIGYESGAYRDIGLVPGVHYISYDGTMEHLVTTIRYYQAHSAELETIASGGRRFVIEHFSGDNVSAGFVSDLRRLQVQILKSGEDEVPDFQSCFQKE